VSDLAVAAVLAAAILLASTISVEIGISVALVELALGVVVGNALNLSVPDWLSFVGTFAGIVLTFLAGAEVDVPQLTELETVDDDNPFILHPGEFVLAVTLERVELPADLVGRLDGKSSLGRLGLIVHSTAGFVDPGFKGRLTLELTNVANLPITLSYAMPVSQISFSRLTTPAERPYGKAAGSKYQDQTGPEPSRYYLNYRKQTRPSRSHRRRPSP